MWLVVAVIANGASLRTAHAQFVTTLDPGDFASGTNVTDAFAGVTLQAITFVRGPATAGSIYSFSYTPSYAPVYVGTDSFNTGATPLFTTSTSYLGYYSEYWGANWGAIGGACFTQCDPSELSDNVATNLLISFATPVTSVSVLDFGDPENGMYMQAYTSTNQAIGFCETSFGPQPNGNYGCYTVIGPSQPDSMYLETETSVLASGSSGISKIIVGGFNQGDDLSTIKYTTFGAPEIDPNSAASGLTLLLGVLLVLLGSRPNASSIPIAV